MSDVLLIRLTSSPVKRVMGNLLVTTEYGRVMNPTESTTGSITQKQRIPIQLRHVRLAVPSCFTKDSKSLVDCDISYKELMSAYNVEENVQRALKGYAKFTGRAPLQDFVMEAPLKVLMTATAMFCKHLSRETSDFKGSCETEAEGHDGKSNEDNGRK